MAKLTSGFGLLLTIVAIMGWLWFRDPAPIWLALLLMALGVLANTEDRRRRMIGMHIAVVVGLVGFAVPGFAVARDIWRATHQRADILWIGTRHFYESFSAISFAFVLCCVVSFVLARRKPSLAVGQPVAA